MIVQQSEPTHHGHYDARSALDLMARSQVMRRIALPGKITRQYGVNRRSAAAIGGEHARFGHHSRSSAGHFLDAKIHRRFCKARQHQML